ncbi:MAG: T4 prohead core scaffold protein [Candidatus Bathyarchaeota archaeon]|nr:T4 prohead core scaffold protein [Candidatus Bathyarchaeota archaeon]
MSVGSNLQEMENVVTKGAAPAEPMPSAGIPVEDLGGPTPENSRPDDDSNKLREPAGTIKQVKDVVNAKAAPAEAVSDEIEDGQEIVAEEEEATEIVAEEEVTEEEVVSEEEALEVEYSIEEDVEALLQGEELSEEFQEKARTIFETAINAKVGEITEQLKATYEEALVEEIVSIKEGLTERLDAYLEYVADEWIQENALQVEHGLKTEMTESFLQGMKGLFEEHYVSIPEEKYDVLESMVDKLDEMEGKLNEQIERNVALNRRLAESTADGIFAEVTEGLALSQKDKLASLVEKVEFESETDYREKLATLRNSYFPENVGTPSTSENLSEEVSTDEVISEEVSPMMQAYLDTLSRAAKK